MRRGRRLISALAAGGMLAVTALSGCSSGAASTELTWYINPDDGGQAEIAAKCSQESGGRYTITTSLLPRDASSQREQLARRLAAGDTSMDIMSLDPPFIPELAEPGFLAPVPQEVIDQRTEGVVDGALESAQWKGEFVTVPFWANTQLLWYRKSVAEEAGLDMSKPVTWDQLIEASKKTDKKLGVQVTRGESMTVWLNALVASQDEQLIRNPGAAADETEFGIDSPAGRKSAEIVGTIGRESLYGGGVNADESANKDFFATDGGSFMVNWPFVWTALKDEAPEVADDMGWVQYPRVDADTPSAPPVGGINLGVGATSKKPELAYEAITCITSVENQSMYFATNGNPPAAEAAYDDPAVKEAYPMAPLIRDSLNQGAARPQTPFYNEVSTAVQQKWTPIGAVNDNTPGETQEFIGEVLRGERLL